MFYTQPSDEKNRGEFIPMQVTIAMLVKETKHVNMFARRGILYFLQMDDPLLIDYLLGASNLTKILTNKLIAYFLDLPTSVELAEDLLEPKRIYSIEFQLLREKNQVNPAFEKFANYISFLDSCFEAMPSMKVKELLSIMLFNDFFIGELQPLLLEKDLKIARTATQVYTYIYIYINIYKVEYIFSI